MQQIDHDCIFGCTTLSNTCSWCKRQVIIMLCCFLWTCLFILLCTCLSCLSFCLPVFLFACFMSARLSFWSHFVCLSSCLTLIPSACLSVCPPSVCSLCTCLFVSLSFCTPVFLFAYFTFNQFTCLFVHPLSPARLPGCLSFSLPSSCLPIFLSGTPQLMVPA